MFRTASLLPLSLFSLLLMSSCGSLEKPEFRTVEQVEFSLTQPVVRLNVVGYNPNRKTLKLKRAQGEIHVEGEKFGDFSVDSTITIAGEQEFSIPVRIDLVKGKTLKHTGMLLTRDEILLKLDGRARLGKSGFWFNYPIRYEGKQSLKELTR